jgi:UrcA family protein
MSVRLTLLAAAMLALAPAASAEDGAWKVGSTYVIRFEGLDLSRAGDRQILLAQVERSATRLCAGESPARRRNACAKDAIAAALTAAPALQATLSLARLERDGLQQAQR